VRADVERNRQPAHAIHCGGQRRADGAGMQDRASDVRAVIDPGQHELGHRLQPTAQGAPHDVSRLRLDGVRRDVRKIRELPAADQRPALAGRGDDSGAGSAGLPRRCGHHDVQTGPHSCGHQRNQTG
jgi:hypothetical protein